MKVYVIYDVTEQEHPECPHMVGPLGENWLLSGFTNDKALAEQYFKPRKKSIFKMKKYKMNHQEYIEFRNEHAHQEIAIQELTTKAGHAVENRKIALTNYEYSLIEEMRLTFGCEHLVMYPETLFDKKYRKALVLLRYEELRKLNKTVADSEGLDYELPSCFFDEIAAYARLILDDFD